MNTDEGAAGLGPEHVAGPGAGPWPAHSGDGGIHIGHQSGGANSTGDHGVAISFSNKGSGPDEAHQRLLAAIADLRARLPQDGRCAEDEALDAHGWGTRILARPHDRRAPWDISATSSPSMVNRSFGGVK